MITRFSRIIIAVLPREWLQFSSSWETIESPFSNRIFLIWMNSKIFELKPVYSLIIRQVRKSVLSTLLNVQFTFQLFETVMSPLPQCDIDPQEYYSAPQTSEDALIPLFLM